MIQALEHGNYYHIYNRGINSTTLFNEKRNYQHFLNLYETHIDPIAETFAWCLMKNHFHFLVRIK
jgi:putative transposase